MQLAVNRKLLKIAFVFLAINALCAGIPAVAQQVRLVTGKITDAKSGEPIPFVTVSVKLPNGTRKGTATDFDGLYHLSVPQFIAKDSIYVSYIGYLPASKPIPKTSQSEVNFQLISTVKQIRVINVTPKTYINPAWEVMANMVKHKPDNDLKKLKSYQYESYNRIELAATNLSEKMKKRRVMKNILPLMDSLKKFAGDDNSPVLPVFMSETISNLYYQNNPHRKAEHVERTKSIGVGIEDETLISQLVSSTFLQYDFYDNYLKVAGKEFISPLSDSWKTFYNYELLDEHDKINGVEYYKIEFKPKRDHDLSFNGVLWLTKDSYALYRIDASVSEDANLNFLSKIRVQQEMTQAPASTAWIPDKTRIVVYVSNLGKNATGFACKFYISNKDIVVNQNYRDELFTENLVLSEDINKKDDQYWVQHRHDSLTVSDKKVYQMIDTVKNMPIVKTYVDIAGMLINGYYKVGKISLGPYPYTYSYNDLEGSVLRLGAITNSRFSNRIVLGTYVSYGFKDKKVKYGESLDYIFSRKPWVQGGISYVHDIGQTGYQFENYILTNNNVFNATIRNGTVSDRGPFETDISKAYIETDIFKNVKQRMSIKHATFDPLFAFDYSDGANLHISKYATTELGTEFTWTPGRRLLQSSKINRRVIVNNGADNPIITFRYTRGVKIDGGNFSYDKFGMNITQKISMGILGKGEYSITGGYTPSTLPFPLLENHRYNFNTMRFLEFASDRYAQLNYTQHMEGLLTNSIPLLKRLNIRTVFDFNILEGSLMASNNPLNNFDYRSNNKLLRGIRNTNLNLQSKPYVEAGYGFENILKIFRVDFLYRLTQTDHKDETGALPNNFATRVTLQFRL